MYLKEYVLKATETFEERPFCVVDSLVLSQLSYCRLEEEVLGEGLNMRDPRYTIKDFNKSEYYPKIFSDDITDSDNCDLFMLIAASRRFRDLRVRNISAINVAEKEIQFTAMAFELDEETDYVAFRGTDGSLYAWKEDFNMAFMDEVPSQAEAVKYINENYGKSLRGRRKNLYTGGHSKGGNLAVYSALMCDSKIQSRILRAFSHDGPGFRDDVSDMLSLSQATNGIKIDKQIPQDSMIGILMENGDAHRVVQSDGLLIMQHSAFNWQIEDNDFVYLSEMASGGEYFDRTLRTWLQTIDDQRRETFVNTLYDLFLTNDIRSLHDLKQINPRKILDLLNTVKDMNEEDRAGFLDIFKSLAEYSVKCIPDQKNRSSRSNRSLLETLKGKKA